MLELFYFWNVQVAGDLSRVFCGANPSDAMMRFVDLWDFLRVKL